jgi:eukaryotic-like serine/threonine-protein kinase
MSGAQACFGRDQLRGLLLGELSEQESAVISEHLAECPSCQATTESLAASDTLIETMRESGRRSMPTLAKEVERVIAQMHELSGAENNSLWHSKVRRDSSTKARPEAASNFHDEVTRELSSVWRPPKAVDEIGRIGTYRILKMLGAGGMGAVFLAEDTQLHRRVALKMMRPRTAANPGATERFLREARAAAGLRHDHIITVFQVGEEAGVPFLAMEFLEGESLDDRLKRQSPLPIADAISYGRQIAEALGAAHAKGLLHRDVKPANVWLEENTKLEEEQSSSIHRVKLLDFGLARSVEEDSHLTSTGMILGTPTYMAPEQASGEPVDGRADLFALGVILYRMTTGQLPFPGRNPMEILRSLITITPAAPQSQNPEVPRELSDLIERLIAKAAKDRPESAVQVARKMAQIERAFLRTPVVPVSVDSPETKKGANPPAQIASAPVKNEEKKSGKRTRRLPRIALASLGAMALLAVVMLAVKPWDGKQKKATAKNGREIDSVKTTIDADDPAKNSSVPGFPDRTLVPKSDGEKIISGKPFPSNKNPIAESRTPLAFQKPDFDDWVKSVMAMPAERQVEAVSKKLIEINPGFDGKLTAMETTSPPQIENGVVVDLGFVTDHVTDISAVRALVGLRRLRCEGTPVSGALSDLSPLFDMALLNLFLDNNPNLKDLRPLSVLPLTVLSISFTQVSDLSPLRDMRLHQLFTTDNQVTDLSPLKGMPLTDLEFDATGISDLSPLEGMPLDVITMANTTVTDLSPLRRMDLKRVAFSPNQIRSGMDVLRRMKKLQDVRVSWQENKVYTPEEFWKKYDAGEFGKPQRPLAFQTPGFDQWVKGVQAMPAEKQLEAVSRKLMELNPGFDGKLMGETPESSPVIENGIVTELGFHTDHVIDISPVRALAGLKAFACSGSKDDVSKLADLSPLKGLPLTSLKCQFTEVSDLSALNGMPLLLLDIYNTPVADLSPLKGMPLSVVTIAETKVIDLSPLKGLPIQFLGVNNSYITDFVPLKDLNLKSLHIFFKPGMDAGLFRSITTLEMINYKPAAEFCQEVDAYNAAAKKPLAFQTPGFDRWTKEVVALPVDGQLREVSRKLQELNTGFDGKMTPTIENGVVTGLQFSTDDVMDISPVRAFVGLKVLDCSFSRFDRSEARGLSNLSPLEGMNLTELSIHNTHVTDLSPLKGMELTKLQLYGAHVTDLSPLKNMPLRELGIGANPISDLTPLKGMPLKDFHFYFTLVTDISSLAGMNLTNVGFRRANVSDTSLLKNMPLKYIELDFKSERDTELLRSIKTLETINQKPAARFWKEVEELQKVKKLAFLTPGFELWIKDVQAMPAEKQLEAVSRKLMELNPGFDGKLMGEMPESSPVIENGIVTELRFHTDHVIDISPVRALSGLKALACSGSKDDFSKLADLSPLKGLLLTKLECHHTDVSDLTALAGMPLWYLDVYKTPVADLSPLKGMPLSVVTIAETKVIDLSPLKGLPIQFLGVDNSYITDFTPLKDLDLKSLHIFFKPGMDAGLFRSITTLEMINYKPAAEFCQEVDAYHAAAKKPLAFQTPGFDRWTKEVVALPVDGQLRAVSRKLQELNTSFDGKMTPTIEEGVVTGLQFSTDNVVDISPVQAFVGLKVLDCSFSRFDRNEARGLCDLSPLEGMNLTELSIHNTHVTDLSPLKGMELTKLQLYGAHVTDLSPLKNMPLRVLGIGINPISDLTPLKGMPLEDLDVHFTLVTDISPLEGMNLTHVGFRRANVSDTSPLKNMPLKFIELDFKPERDTELLRSINTLETINLKPAAEFWKEVEQQEKGKKLAFQASGFDQWVKDVQAMPAEKQVEAVSKKLMELNPGFDGKLTGIDGSPPTIENGVVTVVVFSTDNVTDISPVRAFVGLRSLHCKGTKGSGVLSDLIDMALWHLNLDNNPNLKDLRPLSSLPLVHLSINYTQVSDLSPLHEMRLNAFFTTDNQVTDLSPLKGMPLRDLAFDSTDVSDLSPLEGMPLDVIAMTNTSVTDLSPLDGMDLKTVTFSPNQIQSGMNFLRQMNNLQKIRAGWKETDVVFTRDEFWKKYDAGEFSKP